MLVFPVETPQMSVYEPGDFVKFEAKDGKTGDAEWLWLRIDSCDDARQVVFGVLDSQPIVVSGLRLGQRLAVSFENIREHRPENAF